MITSDNQTVDAQQDGSLQIVNYGNRNSITTNYGYVYDTANSLTFVSGDGNHVTADDGGVISITTDGAGYNGSYNDNVYMNNGTV